VCSFFSNPAVTDIAARQPFPRFFTTAFVLTCGSSPAFVLTCDCVHLYWLAVGRAQLQMRTNRGFFQTLAAQVIHEKLRITHGCITTIHNLTNTQVSA
jgi:hypothetical protein